MRLDKLFFLATALFLNHWIQAQTIEICEPLGSTSCENPYAVCSDTHIEFCECPLFYLRPGLGIFFTTISFEFYSDGSTNDVSLTYGGDTWGSTSVVLYGPLTENSSCTEPSFSTMDPDLIVREEVMDGNLNNVALSSVPGTYRLIFSGIGTRGDICPYLDINFDQELACYEDPCETCIGTFTPVPEGQIVAGDKVSSGKYIVGAWTKEANASPNKTTYDYPSLSVIFSNGTTTTTAGPFLPQGTIIDGWQRIEEEITIPNDAISLQIVLSSTSGDVYFDDIRFFPFDASMKSYVYDPVNMRLSAELDERHYATFYEYDEEGKLVRIKKETEKGVMTIQETKSNSSK